MRVRAPPEHAGRLSSVSVGGVSWTAFSASEETIDIAPEKITNEFIGSGTFQMVATFN